LPSLGHGRGKPSHLPLSRPEAHHRGVLGPRLQALELSSRLELLMSAPQTAAPPFVLSERDGGIVRLTMNRPERFNALSSEMISALQTEVDAIGTDETARVVVLGASGKGFCAGHDLKEMRAHAGDEAWQRGLFDAYSRLLVALTRLPQPVIARVHGIATAAGCQLVSMCDLAVAAETATFALP